MTVRQYNPQSLPLLGTYWSLNAVTRSCLGDLWWAQNRLRAELCVDLSELRANAVAADQRPARLKAHLAAIESAGLLWVSDDTIHLVTPEDFKQKNYPRTSWFSGGEQATSRGIGAGTQGGGKRASNGDAGTQTGDAGTQIGDAGTQIGAACTRGDDACTRGGDACTHVLNDSEGLEGAPSRATRVRRIEVQIRKEKEEGGGESSNLVTHARDPAPTPTSGTPEVSPGEPQAPEASPRGQPDSAPSPERPPPKGPALPSGVPSGSRLTAEVWAAYQAAVAAGNEAGGKLEIRPYTAGNVAAVLDAHPSVEPLAAVARLRTDLTGKLAPKSGRSAEFGDGSENLRRICEWTTRDGGHVVGSVGGKPRGAARPAPGQGMVQRGRPDLHDPLFGKPSPLASEDISDVFGDRAAGA